MRIVLTALLAASPLIANAESVAGEFGLGLINTSGNSSTQSLNGKFALKHDAAPWHQNFEATALNSSDEEGQTAERYTAGYKLDYDFTDTDYAFGTVDYAKDLFGGVREKWVQAVGYGRRVLNGAAHKLDLEIGAGARQQEDQARVRTEDAVGRLNGDYRWKISDTSSFQQRLKVEGGEENIATESVSELKLSIVGNVFAAVTYTVRNNSEVPAGTEHTDTTTAINLSYTFGG